MNFRIKVQKKWMVYVLGLFVAAIILGGAKLNYKEHQEGMLDEYTWQQTGDGGYEMQCFEIGLDKGKHTLIVAYDSQQDLEYQLVDMQQNDGNNQLGMEIASGIFPRGQESCGLEFELDKGTFKLALLLRTSDGASQPGYWVLESYGDCYNDYLVIFLLIAGGLYIVFRIRDWERWKEWGIMAGAGLLLTMPYASSFLMEGDDLEFHLERIRGLAEALQSGQFPVRINPDFIVGYGFSSPMMYPELFLYIPAALYLLNVSLSMSYKLLMLWINLATAGIGYYSFRNIMDSDRFGVICALFYLANPYRLMNMYHRAAVGEVLAQIFLPLLFLGMYELLCRNYKKWWISAVAATGIIQSHILSVEMSLLFVLLALFIAVFPLWKNEWGKRIFAAVKAGTAVIGLNLWFLIPFLDHFGDNYYIKGQETDLQNSALDFYELFRTAVKFCRPYSDKNISRQDFITLGGAVLFGVLVYCFYLGKEYCSKQKETIAESAGDTKVSSCVMSNKRLRQIGNICLGFGAFSTYLVTRFFPWNYLKEKEWIYDYIGVIQFPWRFLVFSSLFFSVVMGIALLELFARKKQVAAGVLICLTIILAYSCMDQYTMKPIALEGRSSILVYDREFLDYYEEDTDINSIRANGDIVIADKEITISNYRRNGMNLSFEYTDSKKANVLQFPIYNYGMHRIYLDGKELTPAEDRNHLLTAELPKGHDSGYIEVKYWEPVIYRIGTFLSLLTIVSLMGYYVWNRKRLSLQ